MTDRQELLDILLEAQERLGEVIESLEYVARETEDESARCYVVNNLKAIAGGYGFFESMTLERWTQELEGETYDDEEDSNE